MKVAIISIGDELLSGFTLNSNSAWMGQELLKSGITISNQITVGDNFEQIRLFLDQCISTVDVILMTGGLGPTHDDITPSVLYDYFKDKPEFDLDYWKKIENYFKQRNLSVPEINKNQALKSTIGKMISNPLGSARGLHYILNNTSVYAMPGVPDEMKSMMLGYVIPDILKDIKIALYVKTLRTIGKGESSIAEQIQPLIDTYSDSCSIAYLPQISGVDIRISSSNNKQLEELLKKLKQELGICLYGEDDDTLESITGQLLIEKNMTIAVAESCTGGLLNYHFTSVSGSSKYMKGGVVAYSNEIKRDILGVQEKTLAKFGAVSEETAIELAVGIRQKYSSTIGISVTGIAGPTGGTHEKPIGLVFIGYSKKNYDFVKKYLFHGDRKAINYRTTKVAIDIVRRKLIYE